MVAAALTAEDTLIYDYDDTVGGVQFPDGSIHPGASAYFDVIERWASYMASLGLDPVEAKKFQHDIDMVLAKMHGFADKTRFAQSMRDAYYALTATRGISGLPECAEESFRIGMSVFTDYPYAPLEGALDVLDKTSQFYRIVIVTKGAYDEQMKKLKATGVGSFADRIFVVGKKDESDWNTVLTELGFETPDDAVGSWAIGNSAKADVNPLLRRGFNGIEIAEKNQWAFEAASLDEPLPGRMAATVTDIAQVMDYLPIPR